MSALLDDSHSRWRSASLFGSATLMAAMCLPLFWFFASRTGHALLENYNEGWNALYIDRVNAGAALYPGPDELLLNNYPPLSFVLVAGLSRLVGNAMIAGRLASAAAFLIVAAMIGLIVARRTNVAAGLFAGSFFGLAFACFPGQRIGLNDPQMLAHAFMLIGLAAIWIAPDRRSMVAFAAVAMVLGGMTKHNLIAIPLATTLWMMWRGKRSGMMWLGSAGVAGGAGLAAMMALGGAPMLHSMLAPRHVSLAHAVSYSRKLISLIDIPLLVSMAGLTWMRNRSDLVFAGLLLGAGLLEMALFAGGDGVVANVAYDLVIAQALVVGFAVASVKRPIYIVGLILFYFSLVLPIDQIREAVSGTPERARQEAAVKADIDYMVARPGPALCFDPALCWYAGRPPEFDPFNMGQQFSLGLRSPISLERAFEAKHYAVVELSGDATSGASYALPAAAREVLMRNYIVDRASEDRLFLVPK